MNNEITAHAALFCLSISVWYTYKLLHIKNIEMKALEPVITQKQSIEIAYSTVTGTAKLFATK